MTAGTKAHREGRAARIAARRAAEQVSDQVPATRELSPAELGGLHARYGTRFRAHSRRPLECTHCTRTLAEHSVAVAAPAPADVPAVTVTESPAVIAEQMDGWTSAELARDVQTLARDAAEAQAAGDVPFAESTAVQVITRSAALAMRTGDLDQVPAAYRPAVAAVLAGGRGDAPAPAVPVSAPIDQVDDVPAPAGESEGITMRATVKRADLVTALTYACKGIPSHPGVPALAGIVITVAGSVLTAHTFDWDTYRAGEASATDTVAGREVLGGKTFLATLKAIKARTVTLSASGADLTVSVDGEACATLPLMPVEDMPDVPADVHVIGSIDAGELARHVAAVAPAAGTDATLPMTMSLRVRTDGKRIDFAATDRFRLHVSEGTWSPAVDSDGETLVAPGSQYLPAAKILSDVTSLYVRRAGNRPATVTILAGMLGGNPIYGMVCDGYRMITRSYVGAPYPPVDGLFPASPAGAMDMDAVALVDKIKHVSGGLKTPGNVIIVPDVPAGSVTLEFWPSAGADDAPAATATVPATFTGNVPAASAFTPRYLVDAVAPFAGTVQLESVAAYKPFVIKGEGAPDVRNLVMPARISGRTDSPATEAARKRPAAVPAVDAPAPAVDSADQKDAPAAPAAPAAVPAVPTDHPFKLPSHLVATYEALYAVALAAGFQPKTLWTRAGTSETADGKWTSNDGVTLQIGTRDGYEGAAKSHNVVSWTSWGDSVRVCPGAGLDSIDQVRDYLAGYMDAMTTCRFASDGLERIYRAVTDNRNPYANPLPPRPFSAAPAPADFEPYADEINGCGCPLCVALVAAVDSGEGRDEAARALFTALYGTHKAPTHVRTVATVPAAPAAVSAVAAPAPAVEGADQGDQVPAVSDAVSVPAPAVEGADQGDALAGMVREIIAGATWSFGTGHIGGGKRRAGKAFRGPIMIPALPDRRLTRDEWTALADQVHALGGGAWMRDVKGFACESGDVGNPWKRATKSTRERVAEWLTGDQGDAPAARTVVTPVAGAATTPGWAPERSVSFDVDMPAVDAPAPAVESGDQGDRVPAGSVDAGHPLAIDPSKPVTVTLVYSDRDEAPASPAAESGDQGDQGDRVPAGDTAVTTHGAHAQRVHVSGAGELAGYRFHLVAGVGCRQFAKPVRHALAETFGRGLFSVTTPSGSGAVNVAAAGDVADWSPVLALVAGIIGDKVAEDSAVCAACDRSRALADN